MSGNAYVEEEFLRELLEDLEHDRLVLPTLPEVALKVRDVVEDENATTNQIAAAIKTDAALSARLIKVANSALLRASQPIETLEAAITRMGNTMLRNLVSSMVMQQMFQATSDVTDTRLRAVWEHSTEVAAISCALASMLPRIQKDQALLAGLVHDIGKLPILARAEEMPELLEDEAALDKILGKLHTRVGETILDKWNFPLEIVAVAAEHENLKRDSGSVIDYVDVVMVANLQSYIGTDSPKARVNLSQVPAFVKMGLDPEVSVVDIEGVAEEIQEVKGLLSHEA